MIAPAVVICGMALAAVPVMIGVMAYYIWSNSKK